MVRMVRRDRDGVAASLRARRAPLDSLVALAERHGLSVALLEAIAKTPLDAVFSTAQLARLKKKRELQAARLPHLLSALEQISDCFTAAGLRFLLLKGPYLAARFYGDIAAREFVDLDLLVKAGDRERACQLLLASGYVQRSRTLISRRLTCFFVHGLDFAKGRAYLDLHFRLSRHPSFHIDESALWAAANSYRIDRRDYAVLSDEYEIVLGLLSLLRDLERGQPKLKNIIDLLRILEFVDADFDWPRFFAARQQEGTLRPSVNLLALIAEVAGAQAGLGELRRALASQTDCRVPPGTRRGLALLAPARYGLRHKLWCARLYETSSAAWLLWWALSLPFRAAVHTGPPRRKPPSRGALAVNGAP